MMPWIRRTVLLCVFLFIGSVLFCFFRFFKTPERLQNPLVAQFAEEFGFHFLFDDSKIIFRPFPLLQVKKIRLESGLEEFPSLSAGEARFSFQFLPLLWGRVRLSSAEIREGQGVLGGLAFERVDFRVHGLGSKDFAPFEWKTKPDTGREIFRGKGRFRLQPGTAPAWDRLELNAEVELGELSLDEAPVQDLLKPFSQMSAAGELGGSMSVKKEKGSAGAEGVAQFQIQNFRSGSSETFSLTGEAKLVWDPAKNSVVLEHVSLKVPFGEVDGMMSFKTETGEIEDARLTGRRVVLETLVRHFPALHSFLPLDLGFSGECEFDLTLRGTWDYLALHANWNLSPAVLTYGNLFSKPKDFPLSVNFDFLLKGGSLLSGDFSVRAQQTTVKGALTALNLRDGTGELTLLTNKFDLKEWEALLVPFSKYEISGLAKVLLNFKGELVQLGRSLKNANLTLEHATLLSPEGRGIQKGNFLLDFSPLSFRVKEADFEAGGSLIHLEADLTNYLELPQGTVRVTSPQLDFFAATENLMEFSPVLAWFPGWVFLEGAARAVGSFLPKPFVAEDLVFSFSAGKNSFILQDFKFQGLGGSFSLKGDGERLVESPAFQGEVRLDRVALARYFEGRGPSQENLEGNLFFAGQFKGRGYRRQKIRETLAGQGTFSVTNGEWRSLGLAGLLKSLGPFRGLDLPEPPSTFFNDLSASWSYEKGKFDLRDLLFNSKDFWAEGKGSLSTEGALNSKLDVYLSEALTRKALKTWKTAEDPHGKQLGPIPLLLIGSLERPELRAEEQLIGPFFEAVRTQRFRKILHKPFLETKR